MTRFLALLGAGAVTCAASADVIEVKVQVTNLAPEAGTYLTPVWVGFHDGSFDLFNVGSPASAALQALAEDGMTSGVSAEFLGAGAGFLDATIAPDEGIPPLAPGETATRIFRINTELASSRYLSFACMVIPSNDAFIANDAPMALEILDSNGAFQGVDVVVSGAMVLDAGTEVNDEVPMNTAFFGQMSPNTGEDENGVVAAHPGFLPVGDGGILASRMFANADFTQRGYEVARIEVTEVRRLRVQFENVAPEFGTNITPIWFGFHDGTFDIYDLGSPASEDLERLAEDGNTSFISDAFAASGAGILDHTQPADVGIPVVLAGGTATSIVELDPHDARAAYFSYESMVVPSNDAFISNDSPTAFRLFEVDGTFLPVDTTVLGSMVRDAGTEVNDEIPMNTAFFGQMMPNTGTDENGVVAMHSGFMPVGSGGILDDPMFANADFTQPDYEVARFSITQLPAANADIDGDGAVGAADLALALGAWGFRPGDPADLNADGSVDAEDIAIILGAWGTRL